jgi:hypothetical protein
MSDQAPTYKTIFYLLPGRECGEATAILSHPDNRSFVSRCETNGSRDGLEIGYHVPAIPRPGVIVEVGRDADIILSGTTISRLHFSFEVHPESRQIMFCDRSRRRNTRIEPGGFRVGGDFRQVVLRPGISYQIGAGGEKGDKYIFDLVWSMSPGEVLKEIEGGYRMAQGRTQNPRFAQTVEEGPTELSSWYNTRLHTAANGAV